MKKAIFVATAAALVGNIASASDFGTAEEARAMAAQMSEIIRTDGLDAGIAAMHDSSAPFSSSTLGIHIFEDAIIVGDNREPELIATSYLDLDDLTGEAIWPRIVAAADANSDAILEWYHYDTEAEYSYTCHSEWAIAGSAIVMVCR